MSPISEHGVPEQTEAWNSIGGARLISLARFFLSHFRLIINLCRLSVVRSQGYGVLITASNDL